MNSSLIFVAGLGSTGSSAVCDLLAENPNVFVPKEEWRIWVDPYCIIALARELSNASSLFTRTSAINNFKKTLKRIAGRSLGRYSHLNLEPQVAQFVLRIATEVIQEVVDDEYSGLWYGNSNYFNAKLNFLFRRKFWKKPFINRQMFLCNLQNHLVDPYRHIGKIVESNLDHLSAETGSKYLALNENFSVLFAEEIFKMHPDSKILLTTRNPLDVYSDSKRVGWLAMSYDIEQFIKWQNDMYCQVMAFYEKFPNQIYIQPFEELILNYDSSLAGIQKFLKMEPAEHRFKTIFKPEVSAKNIAQWKQRDPWLEEYIDHFDQLRD
ncbi:sulfotransferase [Endozoicomonas sp. YOMI1]|uniref:sulfotransferase n=1 Tax=Endozoicomonas sp. YOMI1 TaxID=2828739 RepID=UPI00214852C1|nr:sulfotransferase [Endozoicomonas sp. YOMI1]